MTAFTVDPQGLTLAADVLDDSAAALELAAAAARECALPVGRAKSALTEVLSHWQHERTLLGNDLTGLANALRQVAQGYAAAESGACAQLSADPAALPLVGP